MKVFVGIVLFAFVLVCNQASAQPKSPGQCPASETTFGICTYDPNVNCLEDSQCQGRQLCCPNGCNKICKDPKGQDYDKQVPTGPPPQGIVIKQCPNPSKTGSGFGICSYDASVNCLSDDECKSGQLCCSEGCNKICKEPVTFQPMKAPAKGPAFEVDKSKGPAFEDNKAKGPAFQSRTTS